MFVLFTFFFYIYSVKSSSQLLWNFSLLIESFLKIDSVVLSSWTSPLLISLSSWLYSSLSLCTKTWTTVDSLCCLCNGALGAGDSGDASVTRILTSVVGSTDCCLIKLLLDLVEPRVDFLLIMLPFLGLGSSADAGCKDWAVPLLFMPRFCETGDRAESSTASWCFKKNGKLYMLLRLPCSAVGLVGVIASGVAPLILMLTSADSRTKSNSSGSTLAALDRSSKGRFSHGPPNSLRSLASEAREDLREEARLPRCTCRKAERRPCQPPGDDVWVTSSSKSSFSLSRFLLWRKMMFRKDSSLILFHYAEGILQVYKQQLRHARLFLWTLNQWLGFGLCAK